MGTLNPNSAYAKQRANNAASWLDDDRSFDGCTFSGFIDPSSLKFGNGGTLNVGLTVPPGQVDLALPLRHLARNPVPVTISITVLEDYSELIEQQEQAS